MIYLVEHCKPGGHFHSHSIEPFLCGASVRCITTFLISHSLEGRPFNTPHKGMQWSPPFQASGWKLLSPRPVICALVPGRGASGLPPCMVWKDNPCLERAKHNSCVLSLLIAHLAEGWWEAGEGTGKELGIPPRCVVCNKLHTQGWILCLWVSWMLWHSSG